MKTCLSFIAALFVTCPGLLAQVAPAATSAPANFRYILRYSQSAQFGGQLGDSQRSTPSLEVDFTSGNPQALFTLNYIGGYAWTLTGPSYSDGLFQRLSLAQGFSGQKWNAVVSDDVNYRPQAPVTGFSGIPGTGEPIGTLNPSGQSILTLHTHALNNTTNGQLSRTLSSAMSVELGGNYDLLRFPDGDGLDTNSLSADGQVTRRLNFRNSLSGQYVFSQFTYSKSSLSIHTNTALASYKHIWSRSLSTSLAAGPEWISSSVPHQIPSTTTVAANAGLDYQLRDGSLSAAYQRGTASGSGFMMGDISDSVAGGFSRRIDHTTFELTGGYRRLSELSTTNPISSEFGAIQVSRGLGRNVNLFANYTCITQSSSMVLPSNVLNRMLHTIGFGITYTPQKDHRN